MKALTTFVFFVLNCYQLQSQILPTEGLFDFESIFQQKNIRISKRIKEECNLQNYFIQQTYYNANKDSEIDSVEQIKQVLSYYFPPNSSSEILELLDDGNHFDNEANDGIYGNFLVDDFSKFRTNESIINIILKDTLGISYVIIYPTVNYLPEIPKIIIPQNKSIVTSAMPEIGWTIDPNADGGGIILIGSNLIIGDELEEMIWQKEFSRNTSGFFTEKIPVHLSCNKEYILIIWSYTNTKQINNNWDRGAYSIEWCKFFVDTLHKNENLILLQNFPNPFKSRTTITYLMPDAAKVSIKVYDIIGREITTLINEEQSIGEHYVSWNGKDDTGNNVASGIYFCNIIFNKQSISRKMLLAR